MEYAIVLSYLENILGKGQPRSRDNFAFHCPFCNHRKPKLEIRMTTDDSGYNPWECWVCLEKGRTLRALLKKVGATREQTQEILKYVKKGSTRSYEEYIPPVELPKEFKKLSEEEGYVARMLKKYLHKRGITELDILKYNIGYCTSGEYEGRIVVPSYDSEGRLNYFTGRTYENAYFKYKNPETSRDIIVFENLINWERPVVLVEGMFDAMAVKRNAIPLLGKTLSNNLQKQLVLSKVKEIYVVLDEDARAHALRHCEKLLSMGKRVYFVELNGKDPSQLGFEEMAHQIEAAEEMTFTDLLESKFK